MTTFSFVQATGNYTTDPLSRTVNSVTEGNLLVCWMAGRNGEFITDLTVADDNGKTWTYAAGLENERTNVNARLTMRVAYRLVEADEDGDTINVTATNAGGTSVANFVAEIEYSGAYTPALLGSSINGSGTTTLHDVVTSTGSLSGSDLLHVLILGTRQGTTLTGYTVDEYTVTTEYERYQNVTGTHQIGGMIGVVLDGQSGGVFSITSDLSGTYWYDAEGIVAQLVFENNAGGTATDVDLAAGSYTQSGNALGITFERNVDLGAGSYALTGYDITVSYTTPIDLGAGSYSVTGYDLALTFDRAVDLVAGSYTLTGNALGLTFDTAVDLDAGSYTVTGYDLNIQTGTGVRLDAGSYTVTGYDLGITFVRAVDLAAGSYTVTGYDLSIELAGITNVNLDAGSYTLTGFDLTVALDRSVALAVGTYTLTGNDIDIPLTRAVDLAAGSYTFTGHDLTIDVDQPADVDLDAGSLTLTGYPLGINVVSLSTRKPGGWLPRRRVKPVIYVDEDGNPVDITAPVEEAIEAAPEAKKDVIRNAVERVTEQTKAPTIKAVGRAIQRIDAAAFKRFYEAERQRADDDDVAAILLLAA